MTMEIPPDLLSVFHNYAKDIVVVYVPTANILAYVEHVWWGMYEIQPIE